ncbi:HAD-like domain-containing protein [Xylariaceae sp. FL0016]|nr:HAD-like domain-containing protein [Xylariaceae sp. FL0016]
MASSPRPSSPGETPWKDIDTHHYDALLVLLDRHGLAGLYTRAEARDLSLIWHHLTPWSDSGRGIRLLGTRYETATLSNGNRELLQDLNADTNAGGLGFKHIISTADFKAYKPHPSTYLGAAKALGCRREEVAMVAAHLGDLDAARKQGMRTIFVERPLEERSSKGDEEYDEARKWVDIWVSDGEGEGGFVEVARQLGISDIKGDA